MGRPGEEKPVEPPRRRHPWHFAPLLAHLSTSFDGLLDIINVAHGDFFMLGTVGGLVLTVLTGSFWLALVLVPVIGFVIGIVIERLVIRPTIRQASLTIVTTFGLSMMLQEGVRATY